MLCRERERCGVAGGHAATVALNPAGDLVELSVAGFEMKQRGT